MFYVEHLYNIFKRSIFFSFSFFLFGILVFNFIAFKTPIETKITKFISMKTAKPHFYGLVDKDINIESIRRKLGSLPGIDGVISISESQIESKVASIISQLGEDLDLSDMDLNYAGLKVVFDPEIRKKGQVLLRNYVVRLVGGENVILGPTLAANRQETVTSVWIKKWGYYLVLSSFSIFWLMIAIQFINRLFYESKVIEKFKRTRYVGEKTTVLLTSLMSLALILPQLVLFNKVNFLSLGIFYGTMIIMVFFFNLKKWI